MGRHQPGAPPHFLPRCWPRLDSHQNGSRDSRTPQPGVAPFVTNAAGRAIMIPLALAYELTRSPCTPREVIAVDISNPQPE